MDTVKTIYGYQSSDGSVRNYVVEEVGYAGYLELCQQSIAEIDSLLFSDNNESKTQALTELRESYVKTLNGEHNRTIPYLEPGVPYLKHCKVLKVKDIVAPTAKDKKYRNEVTRYKAILRAELPIKDYLGLIKLEDGKFDSIVDGDNSGQKW